MVGKWYGKAPGGALRTVNLSPEVILTVPPGQRACCSKASVIAQKGQVFSEIALIILFITAMAFTKSDFQNEPMARATIPLHN